MYWIKSPKQSGIKCGVGSHRKFAIFWLITRNQDFCDKKCRILTFHDKKCRIPAFRDKTLLNTVLPCYCNSLVSRSLSLSNALWAVSKGPRALWAISLSRVRPELRDWLTRPLLGSNAVPAFQHFMLLCVHLNNPPTTISATLRSIKTDSKSSTE